MKGEVMSKNTASRCLFAPVLVILLSSAGWATSGFFQSPQNFDPGGWGTNSMALADLNGDGIPDLIAGNLTGSSCGDQSAIGVLLGNGDGTFQKAQTYCTGGSVYTNLFVADLNRDGVPDLIVANECFSVTDCDTGGVSVLLGNGDGTLRAAQIYRSGGSSANAVVVSDLNGDGNLDVAVANSCHTGGSCVAGNVGVLLGNGDGTLQAAMNYDTGGTVAIGVAALDVNRDGEADLIVAHRCTLTDCNQGVVSVLSGNGDGTFDLPTTMVAGDLLFSMTVADVNADGVPDIVAGSYWDVRVFLGNGDGTFQDEVAYSAGGEQTRSVTTGDVNGDGIVDILTVSLCQVSMGCPHGVMGVLRGVGDGTFLAPRLYGTAGNHAMAIVAGDFNRDTRLDVAVANMCAHRSHCQDGTVAVFLNASSFATTTSLTSSPNPSIHGQSVTFTAAVTSSGPAPTGRVKFLDGSKSLGIGKLAGGVAKLTKSTLTVGTHAITAQYLGDDANGKSTSVVVEQVVQ
jgi:hypothetical protein